MITIRRLAAAQYKGLQSIDLHFPERGSFLIEGRNEAGKSTIFDAIHFALYGVPLVGDIGSALHYGAQEMGVQLTLEAGTTTLAVRRSVRQTARTLPSVAELEVTRSGEVELVKGARAVTDRIRLELGGLTAEALLNSCLVAQKQLGRLEGLGRAAREEALTVLLNLSKLNEVQTRLRVRADDEEQLRRASARVDLAKAHQEHDGLSRRRAGLERQRQLVRLHDRATRLTALQQELDSARASLVEAEASLATALRHLQQVEHVKAQEAHWKLVIDLAERLQAAEREVRQAEHAISVARDARAKLPAKRAALARCQDARAQAQALTQARGDLRTLESNVRRLEDRVQERAQATERAARVEHELRGLRAQRRELATQLAQLATLETDLQRSRFRVTALNDLTTRITALNKQREVLAALQTALDSRVTLEERFRDAQAALQHARDALLPFERAREALAARERAAAIRSALGQWLAAQEAAARADVTRRLLDDLALAVAGVEQLTPSTLLHADAPAHDQVKAPSASAAPAAPANGARPIALEEASQAGLNDSGLRLSLIVDHPLSGAQRLVLRLWPGGAALQSVAPATDQDTADLHGGTIPALGIAAEDTYIASSTEAEHALRNLEAPLPSTLDEAATQLASLDRQLAAPAAAFDETSYYQSMVAVETAKNDLSIVAAERDTLPSPEQLSHQLAVDTQRLGAAEAECLASGATLSAPAGDLEALFALIPPAVERERERQNELSVYTGRRQGIQEQLNLLDRNGKERARELAADRGNLARDTDQALATDLTHLQAQRATLAPKIAAHGQALGALVVGNTAGDDSGGPGASTGSADGAGSNDSDDSDEWWQAIAEAIGLQPLEGDHLELLRRQLETRTDALSVEATVLQQHADGLADAEARHAAAVNAHHITGHNLRTALLARPVQQTATEPNGEAIAGGHADIEIPDPLHITSHLSSEAASAGSATGILSPSLPTGIDRDGGPGANGTGVPDPSRAIAVAQEAIGILQTELAALDETATRNRLHEAQRRAGSHETTIATRMAEAHQLIDTMRPMVTALRGVLPDDLAQTSTTAPSGVEPGEPAPTSNAAPSDLLPGDLALARMANETGPLLDELALASVTTEGTGASGEPLSFSPQVFAAAVLAACPEATGKLPAEDAIEADLRALDQQMGQLERGRTDAQSLLGSELPLLVDEAEKALAELRLNHQARRRAQDILVQTRQRMINKVLPDTISNMCLLLPHLTSGRYRYAQLSPDYHLQVWDERKHGMVEKSLFSGGTQDQFSLALRLGFALAALPRELGTSPGFLFLDEPLSSFDRDRTAALVDLLTTGQIATFFQQIFLISHSQAFDPQLFTHHIEMEEGHVAASTLPPAA